MKLIPLVASFFLTLPAYALTVDTLRCDSRENPLGIDSTPPRLSWTSKVQQRGETVRAYQVQVASSEAALGGGGDLWDSGKVVSNESANIPYGGTALASYRQVFWRVRVWNANDAASAWSAPATWTMGVLRPQDWTGQWITAARAANGYHAGGANSPTGNTKWVQVDLGSAQAISSVRLHPTNNINLNLPAYGFPIRFRVEMSNDANFGSGVTTITDQTGANYPNPGATVVSFPASGSARYVRVTPTTLVNIPNKNIGGGNHVFSLSQIEVIAGGQNVALGRTVTAADSNEENSQWNRASLTDGLGLVGSRPVTQSDRFRTNFTVDSGLRRAVVSVCGLGQYEMSLNGVKVGADFITPNWSNYSKTVYFNSYDVTPMLSAGNNAVGIALGNGFYNVNAGRYAKITGSFGPRRAIAEIRLEYNDGRVTTIGTGSNWKWRPGPATFSCVYGGEDVDGRLDEAGWDTASFDAASWLVPRITTGPTGGILRGVSQDSSPTRGLETFSPVGSTNISTGVTVYDFGQNAAHIPTITVRGPAGSTVKLTTAEIINGNGTLSPIVEGITMTYTLKGSGTETFTPKFFYMGYRYVQVERRDPSGSVSGGSVPTLDVITSRAITLAQRRAGTFVTSNSLFNAIHRLVYWSQVSNAVSGVMTDCPQREKLGWQEVTHLNGPALRYELDLTTQFTKQANDLIEAQGGNGSIPSVLPMFGSWSDISPEWGASAVMIPWQQYEFTGDPSLLTKNYASAKRWVDYLGTRVTPSGSFLLNYGLGDWYDVGPRNPAESQNTPQGLTATATYYQNADVLSRWAQVLGNTADANTYRQLATNIRTAFNNQFRNGTTRTYGVGTFVSGPTARGSQTSNAMPLALGMVDPADRPAVLQAIVDDVTSKGHVTAGDVGHRYLIRALADNRRSDVLFSVYNRTTNPGYGYILSLGNTALTESWGGVGASKNHYMLGHVMEWFYHDLAGIQPDPTGPGFKKIIIKPALVGTLPAVNASYRSIRGDIVSNWTNGPAGLTMNVTIPAAASATVHVPAANAAAVQESGGPASSAAGVQFLRMENNAAVFAVNPGTYAFSSLAVPTAPAGLTATAASNGVRLSWDASFDAAQYTVKRASQSGGPYQTLTSGLSDRTFTDATATLGNTYAYVVTATNAAAESAPSNEALIALTPPPAPANVTATPGNAVVRLSWSPVAGVAGYRIKRSSGGGVQTTVVSSTPGTNYVDGGLTNGTSYAYTVTAIVLGQEGTASSAVSATPTASSSHFSRSTGGTSSSNQESLNPNENIAKLFDGNANTKWFQNVADSGVWIRYDFGNNAAWAVNRYTLTSADDAPGRDPAAWRLEGSNDGSFWTSLNTQTGQTFTGRRQTRTFDFTNTTPYRFYRLFITANLTPGSGIQLADFALFSSATDAGDKTPPVLTLPSPITAAATGNNTARVFFTATAQDAVAGSVFVDATPPSGSTFSLGTTQVQCSATDPAGNTVTGTFTVTVENSLVSRSTGGTSSTNQDNTGNPNENIAKLFDGNANTKWFQNAADSGVWIRYDFGNNAAWTITRYALTSANDVPGRDPAAWRLEGSNDGSFWNSLDTQTGQTFTDRGQTKTYDFANTTPYRFYRLFITANLTPGNGIQLAEFALFSSNEDAGDQTPPVLTLPGPITVTATNNDTAQVFFIATAQDAVAGSVSVTATPPSGSTFPLGTTSVQCSATDPASNTATGAFTVTVTRAYAPPSGITATAVSESQIRLGWTDNAVNEASYQIESSPAGAGTWTPPAPTLPANATSGIASGLNASTNYDFRVKATGPAGSSLYATISAATPAGVGDGIPGSWRYQYFGNGLSANGEAAAAADPDGDGSTNAQEYAAGTNPKNSASAFRITQLQPDGSGWLVGFPTESGKSYRLERSPNLQSGSWVTVQNAIPGTGGVVQLTDPASGGTRRFYRVVLTP